MTNIYFFKRYLAGTKFLFKNRLLRIQSLKFFCVLGVFLVLFGCSSAPQSNGMTAGNADPHNKYANPSSYIISGKRYYVIQNAAGYDKVGNASWYGRSFHGKRTSSHEAYNMYSMTAASPVLPIPSYVRVTNLRNGLSTVVKVNDRGPFVANRIIDLSYAAAKILGYASRGTTQVRVTVLNISDPIFLAQNAVAANPKVDQTTGRGIFSRIALNSTYAPMTVKLVNQISHLPDLNHV